MSKAHTSFYTRLITWRHALTRRPTNTVASLPKPAVQALAMTRARGPCDLYIYTSIYTFIYIYTGTCIVPTSYFVPASTLARGVVRYLYFDNADYGFSLVKATCLDNYVHTHEYGHNLGCHHDRESTSWLTDYSHGTRYCDDIAP